MQSPAWLEMASGWERTKKRWGSVGGGGSEGTSICTAQPASRLLISDKIRLSKSERGIRDSRDANKGISHHGSGAFVDFDMSTQKTPHISSFRI
ncbi:hypothetical protein J6590_027950 [Homalodisca vitripennis]|nr:hypothetical protein J6590_027950 [Homalodisca vitripennis]